MGRVSYRMSSEPSRASLYRAPEASLDPVEAHTVSGYRPLSRAAWHVRLWLYVYAALSLVSLALQLSGASLDEDSLSAADLGLVFNTLGSFLVLLVCCVLFGGLLYGANRNARAFDIQRLEFSPASMVWWFFVPFANLVMPYRAVREVFEASTPVDDGPPVPAFFPAWWAAWIVWNVLTNTMAETLFAGANTIGAAAAVASALLAERLVRDLANRQARTADQRAALLSRP